MDTLLVFAHPNPKSFNAALKDAVLDALRLRGDGVRIHDLYRLAFNPVLRPEDFAALAEGQVTDDVRALQEDIAWANLLVFVYPTWWMSVPAILKGYFDRVLSYGFAYRVGEHGPEGLLKGKLAIVLQTAGSSPEVAQRYRLPDAVGQSVDAGTLAFCGIEVVRHEFFFAVPFVTQDARRTMLDRVHQLIPAQVAQ